MPIIMNCTQLEQTKLPIQCKTCQKRRSMAVFTTTDADTNNCNDINDNRQDRHARDKYITYFSA